MCVCVVGDKPKAHRIGERHPNSASVGTQVKDPETEVVVVEVEVVEVVAVVAWVVLGVVEVA